MKITGKHSLQMLVIILWSIVGYIKGLLNLKMSHDLHDLLTQIS